MFYHQRPTKKKFENQRKNTVYIGSNVALKAYWTHNSIVNLVRCHARLLVLLQDFEKLKVYCLQKG